MRKEEDVPVIEQTVRSLVGIGVGYTAQMAWRNRSRLMERNFGGLNIPPEMRRAFTRLWAWSGKLFQDIEFEKRMSLREQTATIINDLIPIEVDKILTKRKEIILKMRRAEIILRDVRGTLESHWNLGQEFKRMLSTNDLWNNMRELVQKRVGDDDRVLKAVNEFITSIDNNELPQFFGSGNAKDALSRLGYPDLEHIRNGLREVDDRVGRMVESFNKMQTDVKRVATNRIMRKLEDPASRFGRTELLDMVDRQKGLITKIIERTYEEVKETFHPKLIRAAQSPISPTKSWIPDFNESIDKKLDRKTGTGVFRSLREALRSSIKDSVFDNSEMGKLRNMEMRRQNLDVVRHIKEAIKQLSMHRDENGVDALFDISIGIHKGSENDLLVIRGLPKNPKNQWRSVTIPVEIPKTMMAVSHLARDGKDWINRYQANDGYMVAYLRKLIGSGALNQYAVKEGTVNEYVSKIRADVWNETMMVSEGPLADIRSAWTFNQGIRGYQLEQIRNAYDVIDKIRQTRGNSSYIVIDTEFDPRGEPFAHQVGWTVWSEGRARDAYQFDIEGIKGRNGGNIIHSPLPAHLRTQKIADHAFHHTIQKDEIGKLLDALGDTLRKIEASGKQPVIMTKAHKIAENIRLGEIIKEAEARKLGAHPAVRALRAGAFQQAVIDVNDLAAAFGAFDQRGGENYMMLIKTLLRKYDNTGSLKKWVQARLQDIGISNLYEEGFDQFRKGIHGAPMQDAYMEGLFAEFTMMVLDHVSSRNSEKGEFWRNLRAGLAPEFSKTYGYLPDFIADHTYSKFWVDHSSMNKGMDPRHMRLVSAEAYRTGKRFLMEQFFHWGPFSDKVRGQEYQVWKLHLQRSLMQGDNLKNFIKDVSSGKDIGGAFMRHTMREGNALLGFYGGQEEPKDITWVDKNYYNMNRPEDDIVTYTMSRMATDNKGSAVVREGLKIRDGQLLGFDEISHKEIRYDSRSETKPGQILSVQPHPHDQRLIVVKVRRPRHIGDLTPTRDIMNAAGLVGFRDIREEVPFMTNQFGPTVAMRTASTMGKANPAEVLEGLIKLTFAHAGNDPYKKNILRHLFKHSKAFKNMEIRDGSPAMGGLLDFADTKLLLDIGYGDIRDVMDKYKRLVDIGINKGRISDPVGFTSIEMKWVRDHLGDDVVRSMASPIAKTMSLFLSLEGAIEKEIDIGHKSLVPGGIPLGEKAAIANDVRRYLQEAMTADRNPIEASNKLVLAIKTMHPDMKENTLQSLLAKLPALMGFIRHRSGEWQTVLPGPAPLFYGTEVTAGWNKFGTTVAGSYLIEALREVPGSEEMVQEMAQRVIRQNSVAFGRSRMIELATGRLKMPDVRELAGSEAEQWIQAQLGDFLTPMMSKRLKQLIPAEELFYVNGELMTRSVATTHFGISPERFETMLEKGEAHAVPVTDLAKYASRFIEKGKERSLFNLSPTFLVPKHQINISFRKPGRPALIERVLFTPATKQDFWELPVHVAGKPNEISTVMIMSKAMAEQRGVIPELYKTEMSVSLPKMVSQMFRTLSEDSFKNMQAQIDSVSTPVVRKQNLGLWIQPGDLHIGTKAGAEHALEKLFGTKRFSRSMFLNARGVTFGENLIVDTGMGQADDFMLRIFNSLGADEKKFMAKAALGSIDIVGGSQRYRWKSNIMHKARRGFFGAEAKTWAKSTMEVLQGITSAESITADMNKSLIELMKEGFVGLPVVGEKYPGTDAAKTISGLWYKANADSETRERLISRLKRAGSGTGGVGIVSPGSMIEGHIDADKDAVQLFLGLMGKQLGIIRNNTGFQTLGDNTIILAGTENGMQIVIDSKTKERVRYHMSLPDLAGFQKGRTMIDQVIGKEIAGSMTHYTNSLREHLNDILNPERVSVLTKELGMENVARIRREFGEGIGQLLEGALKMKEGKLDLTTVKSSLDKLSTIEGTFDMLERIRKDPTIQSNMGLKRLFTPIGGTQGLIGGADSPIYKRGMSVADLAMSWARFAKQNNLTWENGVALHPHVRSMMTNTAFGDVYDFASRLGDHPLLKELGLLSYNAYRPESMVATARKFYMNDLNQNLGGIIKKIQSNRSAITATAGLFLASFMFRPDDNTFLGDRPGLGGEYFDHQWTKPEYAMEGLLNTPVTNPWDKKRAYIMMDNPSMSSKFAKLNRREQRDFMIFHKAMSMERNSVEDLNIVHREYKDYKRLLARYGHA